MVTDFFGSLLQEFGRLIELPDLHPDRNNTCLIKLKSGISVQLEVDDSGRYLIVGSDLGDVPAGRFRETLFTEALKINGMPSAQNGRLAFSKKLNHLILFEMLDLSNLNGEKIANVFKPFTEKALLWKDALVRGEIPVHDPTTTGLPGLFGMKR